MCCQLMGSTPATSWLHALPPQSPTKTPVSGNQNWQLHVPPGGMIVTCMWAKQAVRAFLEGGPGLASFWLGLAVSKEFLGGR